MALVKNPNVNPSTALNASVRFTTTDIGNGQPFVENFLTTGPSGNFFISLNALNIGGNKFVIPLTSSQANGAHYLKFHMPGGNSDIMYVTYSIKADTMADGYYDFINGITDAYRTDLRAWILDERTVDVKTTRTLGKSPKFTAIGKDTNQVSATAPFEINFTAVFGSKSTSGDVKLAV